MPYGTVNADVITTSTAGGVLGAGNASIMKNRIINGAFVIDQYNAGSSVTPATPFVQYTIDRWRYAFSQGSKVALQQNAGSVTPPVGFYSYYGATSQSAYSVTSTDFFSIQQYVEGNNIGDLNWGTANAKTVTLSFWVRSSLTGTFGGALANSDSSRTYPFTYTISSANTWEQKSVTIAGDTTGTWLTTNGRGIAVGFSLGAGSSQSGTAGSWSSSSYTNATGATSVVGTNGATFYITGVQLEVGSSATGFEYRQYQQELALCQRYYEKSFNMSVAPATNTGTLIGNLLWVGNTNGSSLLGSLAFKVNKRTSPTLTYYNPSAANSNFDNGGAVDGAGFGESGGYAFTTTTTGSRTNIHWAASAEL